MTSASNVIANISGKMSRVSLQEPNFPFFDNPLLPTSQTETPVTPNTLNLPNIDNNLIANTSGTNSLSNLTTAEKLAILFNQN